MRSTFKMIIFLLLLGSNGLFAQSFLAEWKSKMDSVFYYVDRSRVATGILSDYGYSPADPVAFNGIPSDTNYVTMDTWKYLYLHMYTSRFNSKATLEAPASFCLKVDASGSPAILFMQYNKLDDDAVKKGLLTIEGEQIREVAGATAPYLTKTLFAVAPQKSVWKSNVVEFRFDRRLLVTNMESRINKLEVCIEGETGYRNVVWDVPLSFTFSSGGDKTVRFRLLLTDGSVLTSRTKIRVELPAPAGLPGTEGIQEYTIAARDGNKGGTVRYVYAKYNTSGRFMRPLIIAEDVDFTLLIGKRMTLEELRSDENINKLNELFDLVYVRNEDGIDGILKNAKVFEDAMDFVNSHRSSSFDTNYVIGIGMGGLVARYGLREMENKGKDHGVSKFISINAPHYGLNFPLGLQAAVRFGYNLKNDYSLGKMKFSSVVKFLDSDAMRQMMIYRIDGNYNLTNKHKEFQRDYDSMGFPFRCRNIAVSTGSSTGISLFTNGSRLLEFDTEERVLDEKKEDILASFGGGGNAKVEMKANALSNRSETTYFEGKCMVHAWLVYLLHIWHVKAKENLKSTTDMVAVDGAPGTYFSLTNALGDGSSEILKQKNFCFVPTVSALGILDWEQKLQARLNLKEEVSFFDQLYAVQGQNNDYTGLGACKDFLMQELAPQISGEGIGMAGDTEFTIANVPSFLQQLPSQLIRVE